MVEAFIVRMLRASSKFLSVPSIILISFSTWFWDSVTDTLNSSTSVLHNRNQHIKPRQIKAGGS